jgi:Tol biopolymer transport system component
MTQGLSFEAQPRFSPDGKRIVYVSDRPGTDNLWISDADGTNARPLTAEVHSMFTSPSWTPDGRYILVSRRQPRFHDTAFELWMYDTEGGSGIRVTKSKTPQSSRL